ncbi:MAG: hypothetical protein SGARI_006211 [Bacillariaceae sp.]
MRAIGRTSDRMDSSGSLIMGNRDGKSLFAASSGRPPAIPSPSPGLGPRRRTTNTGGVQQRNNRRNNRQSMFAIMRRESINKQAGAEFMSQDSATPGQTELHALVASPDLTLAKLEEVVEQDPGSVEMADAKGRLPLHLLGGNSDLVNYPEGQVIAKQCATILMELYPAAIVCEDEDGRMPFTFLVEKWVEWTHQQDSVSVASEVNGGSARKLRGFLRGRMVL